MQSASLRRKVKNSSRKNRNWKNSSSDNYKLILTVGPEGSASLTVTCNHRSPISYNGTIAAPEIPDKK
jgi:hypothetical protein